MAEPPRRRATDYGILARLRGDPLVSLLLVAVVIQCGSLLVSLLILNPRAAENAARIAHVAAHQHRQSLTAAYDNRLAARQSCRRANPSRQAQAQAYLDIARGNRARAAAWVQIGQLFPPTAGVADVQRAANLGEAARLTHDAHKLVSAQAPVALYPHAPSVAKRALVDCAAVYPLPHRRGAVLPAPSKP